MPCASRLRAVKILLFLLAACGASHGPSSTRSSDGSIGGLVRDQDSGTPLAMAELRLSTGATAKSTRQGLYSIDHIKPGRYSLLATYAGQPVTVNNIDVRAGDVTFVDITFTLGRPDPISVDFSDPSLSEITHYKPANKVTLIEGTVSEVGSRQRIPGVVVTAMTGAPSDTLQTVTDDQGRYRFDDVAPGTYSISAYYSVGGRGQIEVRRTDIHVEREEGVVVPLWVETTKQ